MSKKTQPANEGNIVYRPPGELKPYEGNARIHDEKQITAIMASIKEFGFIGVIITNEDGMVLAGHGRLEAAKRLGLKTIPVRVVSGLTAKQQKAYVLADNKIAQMSKWDKPKLQAEIEMLMNEDFNVEITGFSTAEIDLMIDNSPAPEENDPGDLQPEDLVEENPVSKPGDLYRLGDHRLYCSSALERESYSLLMEGHMARQCVTDPPYNVAIDGHVCGSGKKKHEEFKMASGEMSESEFTDFLGMSFSLMDEFCEDGSIIMSFMDWRHQREILAAAEPIFGPIKQLCVWAKDNGGMGTFYRSQHELVYVFKKGKAPHVNNFGLGENGRYRTNVWSYPGVNTFKGKGYQLLKLHPTVKPVSMIADAIRDCSHRKDLILDPFSGSGTILIACERTGRHARALELDPKYVDVAVRRWERFTGEAAIHIESGLTFQELSDLRNEENSHVG